MIWSIVFFAIAGCLDPTRIAGVGFILSRTKPMRLLSAYLVCALVVSLTGGLAILLILKDVDTGGGGGLTQTIMKVVGVVLLANAGLKASGLDDWIAARSARANPEPSLLDEMPEPEQDRLATVINRLPDGLRRFLTSDPRRMSGVFGMIQGLPNPFYLGAIAVMLRSDLTAGRQILLLLGFNVVQFIPAWVPLLAHRRAPEATEAAVVRVLAVFEEHRKGIAAVMSGILGAYLVFV
jgi:hypothetical protein